MAEPSSQVAIYLVVGKKRTFAGALDWPGWCRGGRDEASALQALLDCGPRYAEVLRLSPTQLGFQVPADLSAFSVVERLEGTTSTDFGVPDVAPAADSKPVDERGLQRFRLLLEACWLAFDEASTAAAGHELRKGPRGGGREIDGVVRHVLGAEAAYLSQLGWKLKATEGVGPEGAEPAKDEGRMELDRARQAILSGLAAAAHGEIAARGPRGSVRWTPRYFVRRAAWHVLDHAWEIEDRIV